MERNTDYWFKKLKRFDAENPNLYWDDPRQAQRENIIQNIRAEEREENERQD